MKKKRITVRSAKAKCRYLQDWVAEQIGNLLNLPWGHEDEYLIEPRPMGQKGVDVILRGEALERFPYSIECESAEKWHVIGKIKQVKSNQKKDTNWLVFLKRKEFKKPIVIMDAEHFFELKYRKYNS